MSEHESKIDHLDLSWTKEYIRSINSQTLLEREPMEFIRLKFVYVNVHSKIDLVEQEECKLVFDSSSSNGSWLPEETVLRIIQTRKTVSSTGQRYKLDDILSYIVTVDPLHLTDYCENKSTSVDLKTISTIGTIHIPSSFFIFHRMNTIYFIFRQLVRVQTVGAKTARLSQAPAPTSSVPLSILKTGKEPSKKTTKRVRISPILPKHTRSTTSKIRILDN